MRSVTKNRNFSLISEKMEITEIPIEPTTKKVVVINLDENRQVHVDLEGYYMTIGGEWLKPKTATEFCFCNKSAKKSINKAKLTLNITQDMIGNLQNNMKYRLLEKNREQSSYLLLSDKEEKIPSLVKLAAAIVSLGKPSSETIIGIPKTLQPLIKLDWEKSKQRIMDWKRYYERIDEPIIYKPLCVCEN